TGAGLGLACSRGDRDALALGQVVANDSLRRRALVGPLALAQSQIDQGFGQLYGGRHRVDHRDPSVAAPHQAFLNAERAAQHASAAEDDHVSAVLLDRLDRFVDQRLNQARAILFTRQKGEVPRAHRRQLVGHAVDLGLVLHHRDAVGENGNNAETVAEDRGDVHGRLAWTNHRNGNRLASGVHARVAHTVDHDRVHTIAFSLDDPGDRVRDSQRFVELALDRRGATLDLHLADLGLPPRDGPGYGPSDGPPPPPHAVRARSRGWAVLIVGAQVLPRGALRPAPVPPIQVLEHQQRSEPRHEWNTGVQTQRNRDRGDAVRQCRESRRASKGLAVHQYRQRHYQ